MFRNLKPPNQKPRGLLSWLTSKEKHGLFASQKAGNYFKTSRHKNSPTYCTRGTEITTISPQNCTKKQRWQNDFMQEQHFYQLPNTRIPLLQLMEFVTFSSQPVNRQAGSARCNFVQSPVASYSFHCWLEKHILSIFVYMFKTCICCLHNLTHISIVSYKMYKCVSIWCKCTPFAVSEIPTPLRQKKYRKPTTSSTNTKKNTLPSPRIAASANGLWFLFTEKFIKNIEAALRLQSLLVSNRMRFFFGDLIKSGFLGSTGCWHETPPEDMKHV